MIRIYCNIYLTDKYQMTNNMILTEYIIDVSNASVYQLPHWQTQWRTLIAEMTHHYAQKKG